MSRQKYIRIYVNGNHIRSTGAERWYRDMVLENLGMINYDPETYDPQRILREMPANVLRGILPDYIPEVNAARFIVSCHLIQRNSSGKHVKRVYSTPFNMNLERDDSNWRGFKIVITPPIETTAEAIRMVNDKDEIFAENIGKKPDRLKDYRFYNYFFQVDQKRLDPIVSLEKDWLLVTVMTKQQYDGKQLANKIREAFYKGIEEQDGAAFTDDKSFKDYIVNTVNNILGEDGICKVIDPKTVDL
jgi:hypothetical protein